MLRSTRFILSIIVIFKLIGCNSSAPHKEEKKTKSEIINKQINGESYSDSAIVQLIESHEVRTERRIDHKGLTPDVECKKINKINQYRFTTDSIMKYVRLAKESRSKWVDRTKTNECFSTYTDNDSYKALIFFKQFDESHYSASFELVTINKTTNAIDQMILAVQYGNEQQNYELSTQMINDSMFVRTKTSRFRFLTEIGTIDSTSTEQSLYKVLETGALVQINGITK